MKQNDLKKIKLPDSPGVYFFRKEKSQKSEILYIGKATSLRSRVRSYFSNELIKTRGPAIVDMVTKSQNITFEKTDSVLEAIILESNSIKKHHPKYNTKEKDDRSYRMIVITDEEYPRLLIIRERELKLQKNKYKIKHKFGPYPNAGQLEEALKIIRKIFPFIDTKKAVNDLSEKEIKKLNIKISIGIYPDIFSGKVSKKEYLQNIKNLKNFFEGNKKKIIRDLKTQMTGFAKKQQFEKANEIKNKIFALNHINDVSLIKKENNRDKNNDEDERIEAYDVAHMAGDSSVGVMVVYENGEKNKNQYRKFILKNTKKGDDYYGLQEILERRLTHKDWKYPDLIVVDGGKGQKNVISKVIKNSGLNIEIVSVVKDDKHKAREILGKRKVIDKYRDIILQANLEAHRFAINYHRSKFRKRLK